jgi:hypothetical protein
LGSPAQDERSYPTGAAPTRALRHFRRRHVSPRVFADTPSPVGRAPMVLTLALVAVDRVRDLLLGLRIDADRPLHRLATRATNRRFTTSQASRACGSARARRARRSSSASHSWSGG